MQYNDNNNSLFDNCFISASKVHNYNIRLSSQLSSSLPRTRTNSQGHHSDILWRGDPAEVHVVYPKRSQLQKCLPQENPYVFSILKKNPTATVNCACVIIDLSWWKYNSPPPRQKKKIIIIPVFFPRPKIIPFGQNFRLQQIPRTPPPPPSSPSVKYMSGAPGTSYGKFNIKLSGIHFRMTLSYYLLRHSKPD